MTRADYPSIGDIASQVIRDVQAEEQVKTAEQRILRGATDPINQSDTARDLTKLAAMCRQVSVDNPDVTYDDLNVFMEQCK